MREPEATTVRTIECVRAGLEGNHAAGATQSRSRKPCVMPEFTPTPTNVILGPQVLSAIPSRAARTGLRICPLNHVAEIEGDRYPEDSGTPDTGCR